MLRCEGMATSPKKISRTKKAPISRDKRGLSAAQRAALDIVTRYGETLKALSKR